MKVAISLLVVMVIVCVQAASSNVRSKRGFKQGAADRFSHGFGKRTFPDVESLDNKLEDDNESVLMSAEELAELIRQSPKIAGLFVNRYVDVDGDGVITRSELYAERR